MSGSALAYNMGFGKGLLGVLHRKQRTRVALIQRTLVMGRETLSAAENIRC